MTTFAELLVCSMTDINALKLERDDGHHLSLFLQLLFPCCSVFLRTCLWSYPQYLQNPQYTHPQGRKDNSSLFHNREESQF